MHNMNNEKYLRNKPFGKYFNTVIVAGSPATIFAFTTSGKVNKWDNALVGLEIALRINEMKLCINAMDINFYTIQFPLIQ